MDFAQQNEVNHCSIVLEGERALFLLITGR